MFMCTLRQVAVLLGASLVLEGYFLAGGARTFLLSTVLGVLYALLGLNVMHDSNHGSASRNPTVNRVLGLTQVIIAHTYIHKY
jgi:fatty acid desaturase